MKSVLLVLLVPCLLFALKTGIEPVTVTRSDGTQDVWYRIVDNGRVINPEPLPPQGPPRTPSDTGVLWVDRNHRYGIIQSTAISGDGMHIFADWWLNAERAGYYRLLGNEVPVWESPGEYTSGYGGQQIGASVDGSVLTISSTTTTLKWSSSSAYPDWTRRFSAPGGAFSRASHDGSKVVTAHNGTLHWLDAVTGATIHTAQYAEPGRLQGISLSEDGGIVAVTVYDSCMVFENGVRRGAVAIGTVNCGTQYAAALSGDGSRLVTGDFYGRLRLWYYDSEAYVMRWSASVGTPWVAGLGISRDGSTIACGTGYANGKLCVFDTSSSTPLWVYQDYGSTGAYVSSVALSADGSRIAAASWGDIAPSGTFKVFSVHNRSDTTPLVTITRDEEPGSLFACDISDDGQFATCGGKAVHAQQMGNGGEVYAAMIGAAASTNVGMQSVEQPGRYIQTGTPVTAQATVRNYGDSPASFPVDLIVTGSTGDSIYFRDSAQVTGLAPSGTVQVSFGTWTPTLFDLYRFTFTTRLVGDSYPGDDQLVMQAKCFHDGLPEVINAPSAEVTVNNPLTPRMVIRNNGSYADIMSVAMVIADSAGSTVYLDSGQSPALSPGDSAVISFTAWTPLAVGRFTAKGVASSPEDLYPANDTLLRPFQSTYEIIYDDGGWEAFYWVGRNDNDKFYVRFTPTLPAPFSVTHGRVMVNLANQVFDYVMVCTGSGSKPDTLSPLQVVSDISTPSAPGWAEFDLDITRHDANDLWVVLHWPNTSPGMGVGADATPPLDLRSYFSSNQDTFRLWTTHDWMVRLTQSPDVGITGPAQAEPLSFRLSSARPNPFRRATRLSYEVPVKARIELGIYDGAGRLVSTPVAGLLAPGRYTAAWTGRSTEGRPLPPGIYFARLLNSDTGESSVHKLALLR